MDIVPNLKLEAPTRDYALKRMETANIMPSTFLEAGEEVQAKFAEHFGLTGWAPTLRKSIQVSAIGHFLSFDP